MSGLGQDVRFVPTGLEFVGPLPSWKDVKADYGAKGDGKADDAPAIQAALNDLRDVPRNSWTTLYFPAGTYRIGSTLTTSRTNHTDWLGCEIVGEDAATTVLAWDGALGKWMLGLDAWYCKVSRLTFDGRGKAGVGLMRWNNFSTFCELSDLWFQDIAGSGICLGSGTNNHEGQAEHAVERCRFTRCQTGILTADWNTMDIYVWFCLFEDCGRGIFNNMGGYQAFGNVFLRSKDADLGSANNMVFNIFNNTSVASKCFIRQFAARAHIQGNRIYNTVDRVAMPAKESMVDNLVVSRSGNTGPCISAAPGNHFLVGNTFTVADPVEKGTGYNFAQKIVARDQVPVPGVLELPGPPPRVQRKVFEVRSGTGDDAREIQQQVDAAASEARGSRPVVHVAKGKYVLKRTVVLPAELGLQVIGDGGTENGTVLTWAGAGGGPGMRFLGPSRVTVRDLSFSFVGSGADALVVEKADQVGGRVYCSQVLSSGNDAAKPCDMAIFIDGVENSDVSYLNGGWGEFSRGGVMVKGGPVRAGGGETGGQVALLLGALGNNESRLIDVKDGGRVVACGFRDEMPKAGSLLDLGKDSAGAISVVGMSWAGTTSTNIPFIKLDSFKGTLTYIGNSISCGYGEKEGSFFIRLAGNGSKCNLLSAANEFGSRTSITREIVWEDKSQPEGRAVMLGCIGGGVNEKKYNIADVLPGGAQRAAAGAAAGEAESLRMVEQLRGLRIEPPNVRPPGVTDVKLQRILIRASQGRMGMVFRR